MKAIVIHGPNLSALGMRETSVYGTLTLAEVDRRILSEADALGAEVSIHSSAREGEIIEILLAGAGVVDGAIVNPAAYSHTSRAIADAFRAVPFPVIEVHLSNIHAREPWRRRSVTAEAALGVVTGFGAESYVLALRALAREVGK
jgi:3-dehydroquinate dehydratase II